MQIADEQDVVAWPPKRQELQYPLLDPELLGLFAGDRSSVVVLDPGLNALVVCCFTACNLLISAIV